MTMKKTKVKLSCPITEKDLKELHRKRLIQARALYASFPIATKTWMSLRGFPMQWLNDNWKEIVGNN